MNRTVINYLTNIIGIAIIGLAFYEYFDSKDKSWFISLIVIGFVLLVVQNKTLQSILRTIVGVKSNQGFISNKASNLEGPDPKKEEK